MELETENILKDIYKKIFLKEVDYSINVFLCGANPNDKNSIRNLLYQEMKDKSKYNIVFPEWLLSNLLAKKEYNLLKLEQDLASNVDVIVLPLEGLGTMAELGAFSSFDKLCSKIIVINEKKHKHGRSFITRGPVKLISSINKKNIIYYDKNEKDKIIRKTELDELKKKVLSRIKSLSSNESKYDIKKLFNLLRFILHIIAIFQPINTSEIKTLLTKLKMDIPLHYLDPCLENLFEKDKIISDTKNYDKYYSLTEFGHYYIYEDLLPRLHIIKDFSKIRAKIINSRNRKKNKLNLDEEQKKLLVL